eukprot:403350642
MFNGIKIQLINLQIIFWKFQSTFGGVLTIIVQLGILAYFLLQFKDAFQRDNFTITRSTFQRNLAYDKTNITLNKDNFDFAVSFAVFSYDQEFINTSYPQNVDLNEYFAIKVSQSIQVGDQFDIKIFDINIPLIPCPDQRFGSQSQTATDLNIPGNYLCPQDDFQIVLSGSSAAKNVLQFNIKVTQCTESWLRQVYPQDYKNRKCKGIDEINNMRLNPVFNLARMQQHFEEKEFYGPIKDTIKNDFFFIDPNILFTKAMVQAITAITNQAEITK